MYTLISSVGTGMYRDSTYQEAKYKFSSGNCYSSAVFLDALLVDEKEDIANVILVGTCSSSWDVLLSGREDEYESLWGKLVDECERDSSGKIKGIEEESRKLLEKSLEEIHGIPFTVLVHTDEIDNDTVDSVFATYMKIVEHIGRNDGIILDITHGFRSMPVLLYQTLQYSISKLGERDVRILYADYKGKDKDSPIRDLSQYWVYSRVADARLKFESSFDGISLATELNPYWESGAKWLRSFSTMIAENSCLNLRKIINQLRNSLDEFKQLSECSKWVNEVYDVLNGIYKRLKKDRLSDSLLALAREYESRCMRMQAIMTLQIAVETRIMESNFPDEIGNYDIWVASGSQRLFDICNQNHLMRLVKSGDSLRSMRNAFAHGGIDRGINMNNSPNCLSPYIRDVESLFSLC